MKKRYSISKSLTAILLTMLILLGTVTASAEEVIPEIPNSPQEDSDTPTESVSEDAETQDIDAEDQETEEPADTEQTFDPAIPPANEDELEEEVLSLFNELKEIPGVNELEEFYHYPLFKDGAYDYYIERYGTYGFWHMLRRAEEQRDSKVKQGGNKKDLAGTGADADVADQGVGYSYSNGTLTITGSGAMNDFSAWGENSIPPWNQYKESAKKIVISNGITHIGSYSFSYYTGVTEVVIPSTVESIGCGAFENCDINSLDLPEGLREIDTRAFSYQDNITSVVLPESLERIGTGAFCNCELLDDVYIGSGLRVMGGNPFGGCKKLQNLQISSANPNFSIKSFCLFDKNDTLIMYLGGKKMDSFTIPSGTKVIANSAFEGINGEHLIRTLTIPDSVVTIGDHAFYCTGLSTINFGKKVEEIGEWAFDSNYFTSVQLPDSLTRIGYRAFDLCTSLKSINIPRNVKSIGRDAFGGDFALTSITVDPSNEYYKNINGVLYTKDGSLLHTYPAGKTDTDFTMPDTVITLGEYAFAYLNKLKRITLSKNLRSILWMNFLSCSEIEEIVIPDSVVEFDTDTFWYMKSLKRVTVGKGISRMDTAFAYCENLKEVYFRGNLPADYNEMIYKPAEYGNINIYYPKNNSTWKNGNIQLGFSNQILKSWDGVNYERTQISKTDITVKGGPYTYDGTAKKPSVTVKYDGENLVEGKDYKVGYARNFDAGQGEVIVTGINNYQGSTTKYFTINKANQSLSVTASAKTLKVGRSVTVKTSGIGKITYSLSNSSTVSVTNTGEVWGEKAGTVTITYKAAGSSNVNSDTKTLTLTVQANSQKYSVTNLTYDFPNSASSFGYTKGKSKIPEEAYRMFYTPTQAKAEYNSDGYWGGSCGGFVSSTLLFNNPSVPSLTVKNFRSSASAVSNLRVGDYNSKMDKTVQQFIEGMQACQLYGTAGKKASQNKGNYEGLAKEVKRCQNGGLPVYIAVFNNDGGHALAGYRLENYSSREDRIYLYDCNYPYKERYMSLYKSGSKYTGFYYNGGSHQYSEMMYYLPATAYEEIWPYRKTKDNSKSLAATGADGDNDTPVDVPAAIDQTMLFVNADNFIVYDTAGKQVAKMTDGELSGEQNGIYDVVEPDSASTVHELRLPSDEYTVKSLDDNYETPLEVTAVNANQSASVVTESDEIEFLVDDSQNTNLMNVNGKSGENYEITFNGDNDYTAENDNAEAVFSGKSEGSPVEVGTVDGEYINSGYTQGQGGIREEDIAVNLPHSPRMNIASGSVELPQKSFTFNGKPVEPEFTLLDEYGDPLSPNRDYKVVYTNNNGSGTGHAEVFGVNDYFGKLEFNFTINAVSLSNCDVQLEYTECEATGEKIEPHVTVTLNGVELKQDIHYSVEYAYNKRPGTGEVDITGINGCTGSTTNTFTINPNDKLPEFEYQLLADGTAEITFYYGSSPKVVIPSQIDGYTVTSVGYTFLYNNSYVKSVILPNTVTNIAPYAFASCHSLNHITLSDSLTKIDIYAFYDCPNLNSVILPDSVTTIGKYAFRQTHCIDFSDLPINLSVIGDGAFFNSGTAQGDIVLPKKLTSIGRFAFLSSMYQGSVTIPSSVTEIGAYAFGYDYPNSSYKKYPSFTVRSKTGSAAQQYADTYGFVFEAIDESFILGDADGNGTVESVDITLLQRYCAKEDVPYSKNELIRADVDDNNQLEIIDASYIQRHLANYPTPYYIGKTIE